MKKVILKQQPVSTVLLENVSLSKYYGIQHGSSRGFVVKSDSYTPGHSNTGEWTIFADDCITRGNTFLRNYQGTLHALLKYGLEVDYDIYEFETQSELFTWMAQKG